MSQYAEFDLVGRLITTQKIIFLTVFYHSLFPLFTIIGIASLALGYFSDMWFMQNHSRVPMEINVSLLQDLRINMPIVSLMLFYGYVMIARVNAGEIIVLSERIGFYLLINVILVACLWWFGLRKIGVDVEYSFDNTEK